MDLREFDYIKGEVLALTGVDLRCYKPDQMQRRLAAYLRRTGHDGWSTFFRVIRNDPVQVANLRSYLTINVSSFYRDPARFQSLRSHFLPELLATRNSLRVWSAGCSRGQEPYTVAMMLESLTGPQRHTIVATDIDRPALTIARAGGPYPPEEVATVPPGQLRRYFTQRPDGFFVNDDLRSKVKFSHLNLLSDRFSTGYDLIICRNVVIYFTVDAKTELYRRFYGALRPGGILFVGGTEVVLNSREIGFENAGISFYRRPTHASL